MIYLDFKKAKWWIVALGVGCLVGLLNPAGSNSSGTRAVELSRDEEPSYSGQFVLAYVGSSQCGFSNLDSVPVLVSAVIDSIKERAAARDYSFKSIGIALDADLNEGIEHLEKTGEFDEISVGSGWNNYSMERFVTELTGGPVATPQMILVQRQKIDPSVAGTLGEEDKEGSHMEFEKGKLVYQAVGVNSIQEWANSGSLSPVK